MTNHQIACAMKYIRQIWLIVQIQINICNIGHIWHLFIYQNSCEFNEEGYLTKTNVCDTTILTARFNSNDFLLKIRSFSHVPDKVRGKPSRHLKGRHP